jgi:hypothetical protein
MGGSQSGLKYLNSILMQDSQNKINPSAYTNHSNEKAKNLLQILLRHPSGKYSIGINQKSKKAKKQKEAKSKKKAKKEKTEKDGFQILLRHPSGEYR